METITQEHYGKLTFDFSEGDIIQIWDEQKYGEQVVMIERGKLLEVIRLLQTQLF